MKTAIRHGNNDLKKQTPKIFRAARLPIEQVFKELDTEIGGLSSAEAKVRFELYGPNEVTRETVPPWYVQLIRAFVNPFNTILIVLLVASLTTDVILAAPEERDWTSIAIIGVMVTVSGLLRFYQEYRSGKEAEKLKNLVVTTAAVKRLDIGVIEIPMRELVPGDIIHLAAGDIVPADVRIIQSKDLFVNQAPLTGESEPIEKYPFLKKAVSEENTSLTELDNICFLGTNVVSGTATAVVLLTGKNTYLGTMAQSLAGYRAQTSFEKGVNSVSRLLIRFMLFMVPFVFLINGITKRNWLDAFLFAVSVAVGLTPEMLPMIVTTNLAKGAVALARRKTVVKRLHAIQNFGAMDILCTDKTGTLTLNKVVLEKHLDIHGNEDDRVLRHAYLNSYYQTGLRNLLDEAVLSFGAQKGFNELERLYWKVDEIPFDFTRRRMSVVLESPGGKRQLVTKGAVEEVVSICSFAEYQGEVIPLTEPIKEEALEMVKKLNEDGLRVLAVAQKNEVPEADVFSVADEKDMVLMGFVAFLDPPKDTAKDAVQALREYSVNVKILTGDNERVTKYICRQVGLEIDHILLGPEIEKMSDEELARMAEEATIFARLTPLQKSRIIKALQERGHTVGFLGDGINDAPALRDADVGISVDTAVDIAKEASDIILLEKDLMVLKEGVVGGRNIFGNIIKYIKMAASSNFGNVFSVLAASSFLPFLPMMPLQLLTQNLLYDISQIAIPWDRMDEEYLKEPRKWNADDIGRFMIFIGPISSIFDIATYLIMWFVFKANSPEVQSLFHSGWFVEGLLTQTLVVHMIRTSKIPFIQSQAAKPLLISTALVMIGGVCIPFSGYGASIGLQPLPLGYFPWLAGILVSYSLVTQAVKAFYVKRFKTWL